MDIIFFLGTVAAIAVAVLLWVQRPTAPKDRAKKVGAEKKPEIYRSHNAPNVLRHQHVGHHAGSGQGDIWRTRRQHAAENTRLTGTLHATRILFDHEPVTPEGSSADDLSMATVEYVPDELPRPGQGRN